VSGVNTSDRCLFVGIPEEDGSDVDRYYALPSIISDAFVPEHRTLLTRHLKGGPRWQHVQQEPTLGHTELPHFRRLYERRLPGALTETPT
jgi:hypothetical protein